MRKNFKSNFATSSTSDNLVPNDRFGFTAAKNVLNIPPEPIEYVQTNKNKEKSKTWRSFFDRLENVNEDKDKNSFCSVKEDKTLSSTSVLTEGQLKRSSILERLMNDDIGNFSNNKNPVSQGIENSEEIQKPYNSIDDGINSIFIKKGLNFS